ncbi:MAG: lysostaphin resistance A-like protein [Candidatus Heimdallarchaeota archaeon]
MARLVYIGIIAFSLGFIPTIVMRIAREQLGNSSEFFRLPITQDVLSNATWSVEFWIYMAVGSFILPPILEELFFRGYVQTRLSEDFGEAPAILLTTLFFSFGHVQYLYFGFFGLGTILVNFLSIFLFGYLYYRTKSLVPGIIAHVIVNFPTRDITTYVLLVLMIGIILLTVSSIKEKVRDLINCFRLIQLNKAVIVAGIYLMLFSALLGYNAVTITLLGIGSLPIAIIFELRIKKAEM